MKHIYKKPFAERQKIEIETDFLANSPLETEVSNDPAIFPSYLKKEDSDDSSEPTWSIHSVWDD